MINKHDNKMMSSTSTPRYSHLVDEASRTVGECLHSICKLCSGEGRSFSDGFAFADNRDPIFSALQQGEDVSFPQISLQSKWTVPRNGLRIDSMIGEGSGLSPTEGARHWKWLMLIMMHQQQNHNNESKLSKVTSVN